MAISVEKIDDNDHAIVLSERFDFASVGDFRSSYEGMKDARQKTVSIDFRNTRYIDSSALGMLINAKTFFAAIGTKVRLINTNEQIKKIFSISRFEQKFDIS